MVLDKYDKFNPKKDIRNAKRHDKIKVGQYSAIEQDRMAAALIRDNKISDSQLMASIHLTQLGLGYANPDSLRTHGILAPLVSKKYIVRDGTKFKQNFSSMV